MFRLFDAAHGGLVGVALAGGAGRALADHGGRPALAEAVRRLGPQVEALVIVCEPPLDRFAAFGLPLIADSPGPPGPLAGLHAALGWARSNAPRARGIVTMAGDAVALPADFAGRLAAGASDRIVVARRGGALQPIFAFWPAGAFDAVAERRAAGEAHLRPVIESLPHRIVDFDETEDPFAEPAAALAAAG